MKKYFINAVLFLAIFFIGMKTPLADSACNVNLGQKGSRGLYAYDVNSVSQETIRGKKYLVITGWAVLNNKLGTDKIHNIQPAYTLRLEGFNDRAKFLGSKGLYEDKADKPDYNADYATPHDFTYFYKGYEDGACVYSDCKGSERSSYDKGGALYGGNYLYINVDFEFHIPISDITSLEKVGAKYILFRLNAGTDGSTKTVYGNRIRTVDNNITCIPLSFYSTSIDEDARKKITVGSIKGRATSIRVMVKDAHPRPGDDDDWRKYYYYADGATLVKRTAGVPHRGETEIFLHQYNGSTYDGRDPYGEDEKSYVGQYKIRTAIQPVINSTKLVTEAVVPVRAYPVKIMREYNSRYDIYKEYVVSANYHIDAAKYSYIPSTWAKPETTICDTQEKLIGSCIDGSESKCVTKYPECTDLSSGTECPGPSAGSSSCCDEICNDPSATTATKNSAYCTITCKPSCSNNTACNTKAKLNNRNTRCPVENTADPMSGKCCNEICASGSGNEGTYYCTTLCKNTPPPRDCNSIADPQEKYCCLYPSDSICPEYSRTDDSSKSGECDNSTTTDIELKYPSEGYGDNKYENTACKVSCEEELKLTFQPKQFVRAGMGYAYPVTVNGTRYCTAEYKNAEWTSTLVSNAGVANDQYDKMVASLASAKTDDDKCGTEKAIVTGNNCTGDYSLVNGGCRKTVTSTPSSCSSYSTTSRDYTCSLSGTTCGCSCKTKSFKFPASCPRGARSCFQITFPSVDCAGTSTSICGINDSYDSNSSKCYHYDYKAACNTSDGYYLEGENCVRRECSISGELWSTAQTRITGYITAATTAKTAYQAAVNSFNTLMSDRTTCDNYATLNGYNGVTNPDTSYSESENIQVSDQDSYTITSNSTTPSTAIGLNKIETYNISEAQNRAALNISSIGANNSTISAFSNTYLKYISKNNVNYYDFWNEKSTATNTLEFSKYYYVQRYTGALSTTGGSGYEAGGRLVYTSFYQKSTTNDFNIIFDNIGPNLPVSQDGSMSISDFACSYDVSNMIFPPEDDPNHDRFGSVAFTFRQISLTDPFPGRSARENWRGYESLITRYGYSIYNSTPLYSVYLTPVLLQQMRSYGGKYTSFNMSNPYQSDFLDRFGIVRSYR